MSKSLILIAFFLAALQAISPAIGLTVKNNNMIIKHLEYGTNNVRELCLYPKGGNFFTLSNDDVVFFSGSQCREFHDLLFAKPGTLNMKLLYLNPNTKRVRSALTEVRSDGNGGLLIGDKLVSAKSIKRLRLTSDWQTVLQIQWPSGSSIAALGDSRFIVSGGYENPDLPLVSSRVLVYNVRTKETEQELTLIQGRAHHSSVMLPDGKILCVGGITQTPTNLGRPTDSAEIIDLKTGTSKLVSAALPQKTASATICTDTNGNPVIFGGINRSDTGFSFKQVIRYNLATGKFEEAGAMQTGRYFERTATTLNRPIQQSNELIEECAEQLSNGSFLVDGGEVIRPCKFADFASGSAETGELVILK